MSTSSGESGWCVYCGHLQNEHTNKRTSKCKKCKARFSICQAGVHDTGDGWVLCDVPCGCGLKHYPDKARAARLLETSEFANTHPLYQPPEDPEPESSYYSIADDEGQSAQPDPSYYAAEEDYYQGALPDSGYYPAEEEDYQSAQPGPSYYTAQEDDYQGAQPGSSHSKASEYTYEEEAAWSRKSRREQEANVATLPGGSTESHQRTLSDQSLDPLSWSETRLEEETLASGLADLRIKDKESWPVKTVSTEFNKGGQVIFYLSGRKMKSSWESWVRASGGYTLDSEPEQCVFFTTKVKKYKK